MNAAVKELEAKLIKAKDTSYDGIDALMRIIMKKYNLTAKELHNSFVNKHQQTPDDWIKGTRVKKTFEEFMLIAEKYYAPDEKLPSGRTPLQKAEDRQQRPFKTRRSEHSTTKKMKHKYELERSVKHGADNPDLNTHGHPDLKIRSRRDERSNTHLVYHQPSGITYRIERDLKAPNNEHSIEWKHSHRGKMSDKTARHTIRNARQVWDTHVSPRLPHNAVISNSPTVTYKKNKQTGGQTQRNTRAKLYQRRGFGPVDQFGNQYARAGRNPSPKQRAKGKVRLKPMTSRDE